MLAPLLLLLLMGAFSLGLAAWTRTEVANAARAGAVYATLHGFQVAGITSAAQNATRLSGVSVTATQNTLSCIDPATGQISAAGGASPCPSTGAPPGTYVTVNTQAPYTMPLPIPGVSSSLTLHGNAFARIK